jgi:perosamine synthetase
LKRIDEILRRREQVARLYQKHLADVDGVVLPALEIPRGRISWFVYVVRLDATFANNVRDSVVAALTAAGIGCGRYFAPVHMQPSYAAWRGSNLLPVTEAQACRTMALPFFNRITEDEIGQVCAALRVALQSMQDR